MMKQSRYLNVYPSTRLNRRYSCSESFSSLFFKLTLSKADFSISGAPPFEVLPSGLAVERGARRLTHPALT